MKYIFHLLLITLMGCAVTSQKETDQLSHFVVPQIKVEQPKDSVSYFEMDSLSETINIFRGKYRFSKEIEFQSLFDRDTLLNEDKIWEYSSTIHETNCTTDGFQLHADYNTEIPLEIPWLWTGWKYYYPVFIYNETKLDKMFDGKDREVFIIQEALYGNIWRPIECRSFYFCGNGHWGLKVHPGEFVVALVPKYKGDHKTKMRVRIKIGESLYVSNSYNGEINYSQFYLKQNSWILRQMKVDPMRTCLDHFYGGVPLGYDRLSGGDFTKLN